MLIARLDWPQPSPAQLDALHLAGLVESSNRGRLIIFGNWSYAAQGN
jgi:hypothetical protein